MLKSRAYDVQNISNNGQISSGFSDLDLRLAHRRLLPLDAPVVQDSFLSFRPVPLALRAAYNKS